MEPRTIVGIGYDEKWHTQDNNYTFSAVYTKSPILPFILTQPYKWVTNIILLNDV